MLRRLLDRLFGRTPSECARVGERLQTFLDAELDDEELVEAISAHLEACRHCGMTAEDYVRIKMSLAARGRTDDETLARLRGFVDELVEGETSSP